MIEDCFAVFHTEATVSTGLRNVLRMVTSILQKYLFDCLYLRLGLDKGEMTACHIPTNCVFCLLNSD